MNKIPIVMIDDEAFYLDSFREMLGDDYDLFCATSLTAGLQLIERHRPEILLLDITLAEETEGLEALPGLRQRFPDLPVIIVSNHDRLSYYRQAGHDGAVAYFVKSESIERLKELIEQFALAPPNVAGTNQPVAVSRTMRRILKQAQQFAKTGETVLITGETGVGKDVLARYIYDHTPTGRGGQIYLPVNCTAIEPNLIVSELFGYVKGAFTGAERDRRGLFQAAQGGTIFLDEIGDLPLHDQARLLRVIETREIIPVGSSHPIQLDVRILAATNAPLPDKLRTGAFREDLFYRLQQFALHIPPLREREEDIIPLARYFLQSFIKQQQSPLKTFTPSALLALKSHAWRGNVRELQNTVRRAYLAATGREITGNHLTLLHLETPELRPYQTARREFERYYLKAALAYHRGNVSATARAAGLSRQGLQKKLRELQLELSETERDK